MNRIRRLSRIDLICADPARLAAFYEALGFTSTSPGQFIAEGETRLSLALGGERIDLVRPSRIGAPYPRYVPGWCPRFQHIAIVVSDIRQAYAKLKSETGWSAISTDGPQRLPEASGGVIAFKFQDPEGHPLELIEFSPANAPDRWRLDGGGNVFVGIDHSAISVASTDDSAEFYNRLGLTHSHGSVNVGVEQSRLDDIEEACVDVTALESAKHPTPHVELLCYRGDFVRDSSPQFEGDIAASRLVFELETAAKRMKSPILGRDPDGHVIALEEAKSKSAP